MTPSTRCRPSSAGGCSPARGYDAEGMLVDADLVDGQALEAKIEQLFAEPRIAYLQLHFAKPGCYAARVERA